MKLQDLAAQAQTKQVAKVMESYFGQEINFDCLNRTQARNMLNRVRAMISEARRSPDFHSSEKNPAYLKLVMMEQGLSHRVAEQTTAGSVATAAPTQTPAGQSPQQVAAMKAAELAKAKKQRQDRQRAIDQQIAALNKEKAELSKPMPTMENQHSLRRKLKEASEVQQAQVVLASKDMVDQVQKMIETATSMQFKDLPALVDQIRNEVGYDQATQFNSDATAALSGLVGNLQQSKAQLEGALGVVTGQAPQVPGVEAGQAPAADTGALPAELPAPDEAELDIDVDAEEEPTDLQTTLGRGKR
jgi:hypothetical protein